jgi:hypothetical protein
LFMNSKLGLPGSLKKRTALYRPRMWAVRF